MRSIGGLQPAPSGGAESQLNSVTQKRGALLDLTWPARMLARRVARIFPRSPSETSYGSAAWCVGPPDVYGCVDQTSNETVSLHVALPASLMQSSRRMNFRGPQSLSTAITLGVISRNGAVSPAMTTLSAWTA